MKNENGKGSIVLKFETTEDESGWLKVSVEYDTTDKVLSAFGRYMEKHGASVGKAIERIYERTYKLDKKAEVKITKLKEKQRYSQSQVK